MSQNCHKNTPYLINALYQVWNSESCKVEEEYSNERFRLFVSTYCKSHLRKMEESKKGDLKCNILCIKFKCLYI